MVILDKLSVTVEDGGLRLRLEGLVPPELWPDPRRGSQPESRALALARIGEAFPALIPLPILREIERQGLVPSACGNVAHSGGN
jgi:hypothetical protein